MNLQHPVFKTFLLVSALLLGSPFVYASAAGEAKMVIGKVMLQTAEGNSTRLKRGGPISVGDTVITDERGQAQLIMIDGSNISIRPSSRFKIEEFVATGNVAKDKTHYAISQGGFRSVTGSIGQKNKESFQLKTPVATMGIRGTDFTAKYCNKDCPASVGKNGLFVDVISGGVSMANASGTFNLTPDTNGYVGDSSSKPGAIDKLPDNLLSPRGKNRGQDEDKSKDKKHRKSYPSPEEEVVQVAIYVAPEQKKEIIEEAMASGVPPKNIINGANNGGLEAEEILPDLIKSGKKHGLSPTDLVQPILDSDIKSDKVIKDLMAANPDSAADILAAALATGQVNNEEMKASAISLGVNPADVNAAEAFGSLLAIPPEVKEMLQDEKSGSSGATDTGVRARDLAPNTSTQEVASPS